MKIASDYDDKDEEDNLNALYLIALEHIPALSYALLVDKWRWDVFDEKFKEDAWNDEWWNRQKEYMKLSPPNERKNKFDAFGNHHVVADKQYLK